MAGIDQEDGSLNHSEHPFGDVGQLLLLGLFLVVWAGDSFFLNKSTFLSDDLPLSVRLIISALLMITAVYLMKSGHAAAGHQNGPTRLVSSGAFRHVRHPLYLGSILFYLGLAMATASLSLLALIIPIGLFYNYIASYEEKVLEIRFGQEYRKYGERKGKWLPKIGSKKWIRP